MAGTRTWRPAPRPRQTLLRLTEVSLERTQQTRETEEGAPGSLYLIMQLVLEEPGSAQAHAFPHSLYTRARRTRTHMHRSTHSHTQSLSQIRTYMLICTRAYASSPTSTYIGRQGVTQTPGMRRAVPCARCATKLCHFAKSLNLSGLQEIKMRGRTLFSLSPPLFRL